MSNGSATLYATSSDILSMLEGAEPLQEDAFTDAMEKWSGQAYPAYPDMIEYTIDRFKMLKERNYVRGAEGDIQQWVKKPFEEFKKFVDDTHEKYRQKQVVKKTMTDADKVFENDKCIVVVPNTWEASQKYGAGTKWCISASSTRQHWDSYRTQGYKFYFVLPKASEEKFAVCVSASFEGSQKITVYNAQDNEISDIPDFGIPDSLFVNVITKKEWLNKYDHEIHEDGSVSIKGHVSLYNMGLTELPFVFRDVTGEFDCSSNNLTSLKGAPRSVGNKFNCADNKLTSLEHGPASVGNAYICDVNELESLRGAPRSVYAFYCSGNRLKTLEGCPETVSTDFYCANNMLTSLKGAPRSVGETVNLDTNRLTTLEGGLEEVGGSFYCRHNKLKSLVGAPATTGTFNCAINELETLKGAPREVRTFNCSKNRLTTLEGAPDVVRGSFICSGNFLTSLKGAPKDIGGSFDCSYNHLTSLDEGPMDVGGDYVYDHNPVPVDNTVPKRTRTHTHTDFIESYATASDVQRLYEDVLMETPERIAKLREKYKVGGSLWGDLSDEGRVKEGGIPEDAFKAVIQSDPTARVVDGEVAKCGIYSDWMLSLYKSANASRFIEDLYKTVDALKLFDRFKGRLPVEQRNIWDYRSSIELERIVEPFKEQQTRGDKKKSVEQGKDEIELLLDDKNWTVLIPKTYEASRYWGKGTRWCTAADSDYGKRLFLSYSSNGPLFIIINKGRAAHNPDHKFQLHFPSKQFMDAEDREIDTFALFEAEPVRNVILKHMRHLYEKVTPKELEIIDWREFVRQRHKLCKTDPTVAIGASVRGDTANSVSLVDWWNGRSLLLAVSAFSEGLVTDAELNKACEYGSRCDIRFDGEHNHVVTLITDTLLGDVCSFGIIQRNQRNPNTVLVKNVPTWVAQKGTTEIMAAYRYVWPLYMHRLRKGIIAILEKVFGEYGSYGIQKAFRMPAGEAVEFLRDTVEGTYGEISRPTLYFGSRPLASYANDNYREEFERVLSVPPTDEEWKKGWQRYEDKSVSTTESILDVVPALRLGGTIVRGMRGDTHQDVLNRWITAHTDDEAANAWMEFLDDDTHVFVEGDTVLTRDQLKAAYGVVSSQSLRQAQQSVQESDYVPRTELSPQSKNLGDVLLPINVEKFDAAWSRRQGEYVAPGQEGIAGRRNRFEQFYGHLRASKGAFHAPVVSVNDGVPDFVDGRHRYSWQRDNHISPIYIAFTKESVHAAYACGFVDEERA